MNHKISVVFRLDAGPGIGLGHYYRCKSLADKLNQKASSFRKTEYKAIECDFAVLNRTANFLEKENLKPHNLFTIQDEQEFIAKASHYNFIVIDHYQYDGDLLKQLSELKQTKLIVIDDECNRGNLYADMVINPADTFDKKHYQQLAANASFCLGHQYALIRSEFVSAKNNYPFIDRKKIIISFGGADTAGLTIPTISKMIGDYRLINYEVVVITGAACKNIAEINHLCNQASFTHLHHIDNMSEVLSQAVVAISAAGSTVYELAACGVPSVFAIVARNQQSFISKQQNYQWCQFIDCLSFDGKTKDCVSSLIDAFYKMLNLNQSEQLLALSNIATAWVDGKGAERIANQILKL